MIERSLLALLLLAVTPVFAQEDDLPAGALRRLGSTAFLHDVHAEKVRWLADGKRIVAGGNGWISVFDTETGRRLQHWQHPGDSQIAGLAVSAEGALVAATSHGPTVRVWDADTGEVVRDLACPDAHSTHGVGFASDGRIAVSFSTKLGIWAAEGTEPTHLVELNFGGFDLSWSASGERVAAVALYAPGILLVNTETGTVEGSLEGLDRRHAVAWGPGDTLASTGSGALRLWDAASCEVLRTTEADGGDATCWSQDGGTVVTLGSEGASRVARGWDPSNLALRWQVALRQHGSMNQDVSLSPDGKTLAVALGDSHLTLYDVASGRELNPPIGHVGPAMSVAISPDGTTVATGHESLILWDAETGAVRRRVEVMNRAVVRLGLAYAPDGTLFVSEGIYRGLLRAIAPDGTARELWRDEDGADALAVTRDGSLLAVGSRGIAFLIDPKSGEARQIQATSRGHYTLAFSPDGRRLAATGYDEQRLRVWDVGTSELHYERPSPVSSYGPACYSSTGLLAVADSMGTVTEILDAESGEPRAKVESGQPTSYVGFTPDGSLLVTHCRGVTTLWKAPDFVEVGRFEAPTWRSIAISADGTRLVSGNDDGTSLIWDLPALTAGD